MGKRPRINWQERKGLAPIEDHEEFTTNIGTKNAKLITTISEHIYLEVWFDKHYANRIQHGDVDGPREGISPARIISLIKVALKHIIFYASRIKGFSFLNHESDPNTRLILKDSYTDGGELYTVVEMHFKKFNRFECTVITARCHDFKIGSGQYFIEVLKPDESVLKRMDNGKVTEVFNCRD